MREKGVNVSTFIVNRAKFNAGPVGGCDPNQRIIKRNKTRGFLKNRHPCFELSHSVESSLRSLSTM